MAGRGPQTFQKRQREQQRKEKQAEKLARRQQRKEKPDSSGPEIEAVDRDIPVVTIDHKGNLILDR